MIKIAFKKVILVPSLFILAFALIKYGSFLAFLAPFKFMPSNHQHPSGILGCQMIFMD